MKARDTLGRSQSPSTPVMRAGGSRMRSKSPSQSRSAGYPPMKATSPSGGGPQPPAGPPLPMPGEARIAEGLSHSISSGSIQLEGPTGLTAGPRLRSHTSENVTSERTETCDRGDRVEQVQRVGTVERP